MRNKYILFDLDGTLTNPAQGITEAVAYAFVRSGLQIPPYSTLLRFIGPPLVDSFMNIGEMNNEDAIKARAYYREKYAQVSTSGNVLYTEIPGLLSRLVGDGHVLCVATSKPASTAGNIIKYFGLDKYFSFVAGTSDGVRDTKADVIEYALASIGCTDKRDCVMVGDREHDIFGAKQAGITSVGVLYGYGSRDELEAAGADAIAEDIVELTELLCN